MRYSKIFPKLRRDDPADVPSPGTRLLIRGGFIAQVAGGIWVMTPLGLAVRRQVEHVVRQEMERAGAVELELPILHPRALWDETGRWVKYAESNTSFRLKDRKGAEFMLAATAEELITHFARSHIQTYKDLPITLWQMSPKYRDELRPRQGLIRGREFVMKDAYSFGATPEDMRLAYDQMEEAYRRVFKRCGFNFIEVEADSGSIGGSGSAEFMAVTDVGEDVLLYCPLCNYGGNQEKTSAYFPPYPETHEDDLQEISTPNIRTVKELEDFVSLRADQMAKTIVMMADDKPVVVTMRGDLEISELKLANLVGAHEVKTAEADVVRSVTRAPVGFAGPIGLYGVSKVPYFFDSSVEGLKNFLCGANKEDIHFINVNSGRDFPAIQKFHDLSKAVAGQLCPSCKTSHLTEKRGIELGHIFQLQQAYSTPMRAGYTNQSGGNTEYWMGCYGIGVSRIVQAIVEQQHDDRGIRWPWILAPYQLCIIPASPKNNVDADTIYEELKAKGWRVLIDDRETRIGEKLTVAEVLGWPIQILVGRSWDSEKKLEVRLRNPRDTSDSRFSVSKEGALPTAFMSLDELDSYCKKLNQGEAV